MKFGMEDTSLDGLPRGVAFCNAVKDIFAVFEGQGISVAQYVGCLETVILACPMRDDEPLVAQQLVDRLDTLFNEHVHKGLAPTEAIGALRCLQFDIMRTAVSEIS
jgi:hypothetical protein